MLRYSASGIFIAVSQIERVDFSEGHMDVESSKNIKAFGGMWCCIVLAAGYG